MRYPRPPARGEVTASLFRNFGFRAVYRGDKRIMENKMEATTNFWATGERF